MNIKSMSGFTTEPVSGYEILTLWYHLFICLKYSKDSSQHSDR